MERVTARSHNRFVFCVVVVEFAVNGNQALWRPGLNSKGVSQEQRPPCELSAKEGKSSNSKPWCIFTLKMSYDKKHQNYVVDICTLLAVKGSEDSLKLSKK